MSDTDHLWRVSGVGPAAFADVTGAGVVIRAVPGAESPQFLLKGDPAAIRVAVQAYGEGASAPARRFARRLKELGVYVKAAERAAS